MTLPIEEMRDRAAALLEQLEAVLLRLAGPTGQPASEDAASADALRGVASALARWAEAELDDPDFIAHWDVARDKLLSARAGLQSPLARKQQADLSEMADWIGELREGAVELVVQNQDRMLRARSEEPVAAVLPFVASIDRPAVHDGVELIDLRLLPREPSAEELDAIDEQLQEQLLEGEPVADAATILAEEEGVKPPTIEDAVNETDREAARNMQGQERVDKAQHEPVVKRREVERRPPSPTEATQLQHLMRATNEDLAILGTLRKPLPTEGWRDSKRFEHRLLASLDLAVSLDRPRPPVGTRAGVVASLWRYTTGYGVPDSGRAFALSFVLACLNREEAMRLAVVGLQRAEPRTHRAFEEAFSLGSSPRVDEAMSGLARTSSNASALTVALAAMRRRARVDVGAVVPLAGHPEPSVSSAACRCLAFAPPEVAVEILRDLLPRLRGEPAASAAETLTILGSRVGIDYLRAPGHAAPPDRAAQILAVVGEKADRDALLEAVDRKQLHPAWLGWHGSMDLVDPMIKALKLAGPMTAGEGSVEHMRLAQSLHRLTGAGLEPYSELDTRLHLTVVPERWSEILAEVTPGFQRAGLVRVRHGQEHSPEVVLDDLVSSRSVQRDRATLWFELSRALGAAAPFDPDGWVGAQVDALEEVRARLRPRRA